MLFAPTGLVYLIANVPLDNTYAHTIRFPYPGAQIDYFISNAVYTFNEVTFIRKDTVIRLPINYENAFNINYLMYRNSSNKYIMCFVTDKIYVNDAYTMFKIETDVMQTWHFDYEIKPSFIEREHSDRWTRDNNDNLIPVPSFTDEGLTYGDEYVKSSSLSFPTLNNIVWFLITTTDTLGGGESWRGTVLNHPSPFEYYLVPHMINDTVTFVDSEGNSIADAGYASRVLAELGQVVSISLITYLPFSYTASVGGSGSTPEVMITFPNGTCMSREYNETKNIFELNPQNLELITTSGIKSLGSVPTYFSKTFNFEFAPMQDVNPARESKLLMYPYHYYLLTDNRISPQLIKAEYINNPSFIVRVSQNISQQIKTKFFIEPYKNEGDGKFNNTVDNTVNELPLISDAYINYLYSHKASTISGMSIPNIVSGAGTAIAGAFTGNSQSVMGGLQAVTGELFKKGDIKGIPDSVRNAGNNISFDLSDGNIFLNIVRFEITDKYKKLLSDYFMMYGYKCQEVKVPDLTSRYYYNYIKTVGANITGNMDINDLTRIKTIFNAGITFWHYRNDTMFKPLSYEYDNFEVSLYE